MRKPLRLLNFVFVFASMGCNYNNLKNEGANPTFDSAAIETPDFNLVLQAVIAPKCLGCHAQTTGNKGSSNLETYSNVRSQLNKIRFRALEDFNKPMPPEGGLSDLQKRILQNWYDSGAPERPIAGGEKPDPELERGPINWDKIRVKIFEKRCAACHFPGEGADAPPPVADLDLSQFVVVKEKAAKIIDRLIIRQDMPLAPFPALNPRERRVLLKWFDLGMPN